MEDRARRNNLRFRGIPESVPNAELHNYLLDMFQCLTPETHPDQLIIDRAHRLRRPKHLPTTAARDVIARIHFFHAKERIMKASRKADMPEAYSSIKIFADLSADTLHFRKTMGPVTSALRDHNVNYRWGYPAKLLISYQDAIHPVNTVAQGIQQLKEWGLPIQNLHPTKAAKVPRMSPEWTTQ
ncbi:Hypothetical predicted protein [Pelobates cultripes]|uniref:Uncharacterized protein n=1 Tax=Pelobates cultripes TaxID=61616 RepID=A0AAD1W0M7_PELCU|nr:Hypothetical predicted protein [Pelobates cultripes]